MTSPTPSPFDGVHRWIGDRDRGTMECRICGCRPDGGRAAAACAGHGTKDQEDVAYARQIDFPDGRRIWCPPTGEPFWVGPGNDLRNLTEVEKAEYGL